MKNLLFITFAILILGATSLSLRKETETSKSQVHLVKAEIAEPIHYENQYHTGGDISPEIVYGPVSFRFKETEQLSSNEKALGKMRSDVHYSSVETVQVEPESEGGFFSPEIVSRFVEVDKVSKNQEERKHHKKHHNDQEDNEAKKKSDDDEDNVGAKSKQDEDLEAKSKQDDEELEAKSKQDDESEAKKKSDEEELGAKVKQDDEELEAKSKQDDEELGAKVKQEDESEAKKKSDEEELGAKVKQEDEELEAKSKQDDEHEAKSKQDEGDDLSAKIKRANKAAAGLDIVHPEGWDHEYEQVSKVAHISDYSQEDLIRIANGGARVFQPVHHDNTYNMSPEIYHHVIQSATTQITTARSPLTETKKVLWRDFVPPSNGFDSVVYKSQLGQTVPDVHKDELGHPREYWANVLNYPTPVDVGEVIPRPSSGLEDLTNVANPINSREFTSTYDHEQVPNPV